MLPKLYMIPKLGTGLWELKAAYWNIDKTKRHTVVKYSKYIDKYKDKHNSRGEYVTKLAYNVDHDTVFIEIPQGKLTREREI